MKKILIVSSVFPFPADTGKKIVLGGFLKYFKFRYGDQNVEWLYVGNELPDSVKSSLRFHVINLPSSFLRLLSVFRYALFGRKKSIQEAILFTDKLARSVRSKIRTIQPDLIMLDTVRAAQYGVPDEYMSRSFLYLEDLFSVRYQRMLDALHLDSVERLNVLGNFATFIPSFLRPLIQNSRIFQRGLLGLERKLIERSEIAFSMRYPLNILLNADEVKLLLMRSPQAHVMLAKPVLPSPAPDSFKRRYDKSFSFVFIGSLNYAPNEVAMLAFIESALPMIVVAAPDFRLKIIGKHASDKLKAEIEKFPNHIQLMGFVPDLTEVFATCCGMIVPMTFGTGIKLKTLEALSYGVPLISTSIGVEGIPVVNGTHCLIENDLTKFPQLMLSLRDINLNELLSLEARNYFVMNYSQVHVFNEYDTMFQQMAGNI